MIQNDDKLKLYQKQRFSRSQGDNVGARDRSRAQGLELGLGPLHNVKPSHPLMPERILLVPLRPVIDQDRPVAPLISSHLHLECVWKTNACKN